MQHVPTDLGLVFMDPMKISADVPKKDINISIRYMVKNCSAVLASPIIQ